MDNNKNLVVSCDKLPGAKVIEKIRHGLDGVTPVIGSEVFQQLDMSELIDCFEYYVCIWLKKPITILRKYDDPDLDFAILSIINSIPEFFDKVRFPHQCSPEVLSSKQRIKRSLKFFFPEANRKTIKLLYGKVRNSLAHSGFTREQVNISRNYSEPVKLHTDNSGESLEINPLLLSEVYLNGIDKYIIKLRECLEKYGEQEVISPLFNFRDFMSGKTEHFITLDGSALMLEGEYLVIKTSDNITGTKD